MLTFFLSERLVHLNAEQLGKLDIKTLDIKIQSFNAWCPLKGHTYLNKPV